MDLDELAPGLKQLPETLSFLRTAAESGDLNALADPSRVESYATLLLGGSVVYLGGAFALGRKLHRSPADAQKSARQARDADDVIERADNTPWPQRAWWGAFPPHDLMKVDGLVIDRTGQRSHMLWVGPTGRGKSQSVATVRCDGKRPVLAAMPDLSDPLRERADFIWTAGESDEPVNFLIGPPGRVAEMLTEVFPSGGNGVWKRDAFMATKQIIETLDALHEPRSLMLIGEQLRDMIRSDRSLKMSCEGWVTRFLGAAEAMGASAGPGGVDVSELLRAEKMVVLDNDAWRHPGLKGDVVAFGLAEARRCGDLVPGGFRLIFEEADQLGERMVLADPFFTAGRRRVVAVDALVHSEHKLPDAMATNTATRAYFRPNKPEHRAAVAKALDLPEAVIDRIPDYHAIIEHDGKIRRLVHFPKPKRRRAKPGLVVKQVGNGNGNVRVEPRRLLALPPPSVMPTIEAPVAEEVVLPFEQLPSWLGMDRALLRQWTQCKRTGVESILWSPERGVWFDPRGCLEWQGLLKIAKTGVPPRPRSTRDGRDVTPYRELYQAKFGVPADPTFDHWCDNPICCDPDHGEPCSIPDNNARRTFRSRAFEAAGFTLQAVDDERMTAGQQRRRWARQVLSRVG